MTLKYFNVISTQLVHEFGIFYKIEGGGVAYRDL